MRAKHSHAHRGRPRRQAPHTLPKDLYDYDDDPAPRIGSPRGSPPDAFDVEKLPVIDDWPERVPIRQQKIGTRVMIPVGASLRKVLDATERRSPIVLVTLDGRPWTPDGFRVSWRKAVAKAGISGLTFNDLRGTAVTRLALAGCTEAEIATLTGHSLRDVRSILDAHYLARDPALAENAIRKLETRTKIPD